MKIEIEVKLKTTPIGKEYETITSQFTTVLEGDSTTFLNLTDRVVDLVKDVEKPPKFVTDILDLLAQPPDRISAVTPEEYAKIRQAILDIITNRKA